MKPHEIAASLGIFLLFLAGWQWGPALLHVPSYIVPSFMTVVHEFERMATIERLAYHVSSTALSVLVGFTVGSAIGMVTGYLLGMSPIAEIILSPYILGLQISPKVAFAPLFIMWFGYTVYPKIAVAILIVFFPVLVNVLSAMRNIDPDMRNLARSFSASRGQVFWKIDLPATLPALFAGLRISATLAVIGIAVGEMVGGSSGLGYLLVYGEGQADTPMVFVTIILLTLIGIVAYVAVVMVERWLLRWVPRA